MDAASQAGLSKPQLLAVAKGLRACDPACVDAAIAFFVAESRGYWHNRARAKFARRLKHCVLAPQQSALIVSAVAARLESGRFAEQFSDQLRLALSLDRPALLAAAERATAHPGEYVRRYASWVLEHHGAGNAP